MKVIVLAGRKGGCGKTSLARNLAIASDKAGYVTLLFDLDPQATLSRWGQRRDGAAPEVIESLPPTLANKIAKAGSMGAEIVFVDTPPAAGDEIRSAIQPADIVLIPCRPSIDDLEAVGATAGIAQTLSKPSHVVLNACTVRSSLTEEAAQAVAAGGGSICPVRVHERTIFKRSAMAGQGAIETEPAGKAASEINELWGWLCLQLNIQANKGASVLAPIPAVVHA